MPMTGPTWPSIASSPADADTNNVYMVTVNADDGTNMAEHSVIVMVTNVDDPGTVTLWVGTASLTEPAIVGEELTGLVVDPDGGVTGESWQWMKADSATGQFADIDGATSASYTPVETDASMYIKVMATYTDAVGSGKTAESPSVMVQLEAVPMTLLERYDNSPNNGKIDREEVLDGIDDFFEDPEVTTRDQVLDLIDLFYEGLGS
jgi:hypothetical protein